MHPTGKGMFVRNWTATGEPEKAVARAKDAGIAWVSPLYGWWGVGKKAPRNVTNAKRYGDAFKAAGIQVWPWIYPVPSRLPEVSEAIKRAVELGDSGIILDPEAEYRKRPNDALKLMALARSSAGNLPVGVSSYGYTQYHPTFPYAEFSSADFGVPQVYDLKDNQKPSYQKKGVQSWRDAGFDTVIPALTTASSSLGELMTEIAQTPLDDDSVVFWDWQTTQSGEWAAIRSLDLRPTPFGGIAIAGGAALAVGALVAFWIWKEK